MDMQCTAVFRRVPEGYIAFIEEFPGANTQGASLEEARTNLREAVAMVVEANRVMARKDASGGGGHQRTHHRHGVKRRLRSGSADQIPGSTVGRRPSGSWRTSSLT